MAISLTQGVRYWLGAVGLGLLFLSFNRPAAAEKPAILSTPQIASSCEMAIGWPTKEISKALDKYTQAYLGVVSGIRGQDFVQSVLPSIYNRQELGAEMLRIMQEEYTAEELELMESSYKVFGLVEPQADCQALISRLLTEEVAGFYDPDQKRMVLIVEDGPVKDPGWFGRLLGAKPAFDKDEQKTTLAHELTHALQDQLYDLNAMEAGIEDDDDMLLAFSALVEGDATLVMFAEAQDEDVTQMDPAALRATFSIMSWMMPLAGGEAYRQAPPIFRESLLFPYLQGMLFVLEQAGEGGWDSVHACYASPPLSTEQILHPEKYAPGEQHDAPQSLELPELASQLPTGWQPLGGNCLGELQTRILLTRVPGGAQAARGWDGDRYEVFRNADGHLAMASVSVWDSPRDAQEFAHAYRRYRGMADDPKSPSSSDPSPGSNDQQPEQPAENELPASTAEAHDPASGDAQDPDAQDPDAQDPDAQDPDAQDPDAQYFESIEPPADPAAARVFAADAWRAIHLSGIRVSIVEGFDQDTTRSILAELPRTEVRDKSFPLPSTP